MTIAIDPKATFEWIDEPDLKLAEDDPNRTVWECRVLTPTEEGQVQNLVSITGMGEGEESSTRGYGDIPRKTIRLGLVGVRNFRDKNGEEIDIGPFIQRPKIGSPFVKEIFLGMIPSKTRGRMCNAITEHGSMDEDEEKKP